MKEKTLLKIALICSILGIFLIYIVSDNITIKETTIEKITQVGDDVKVLGTINKVIHTRDATIIQIQEPKTIPVFIFEKVDLKKGDYIEVIGQIDEYEGQLEIIGERIRLID